MITHSTVNTRKAKAILPEDVFNGVLVEVQHWVGHHGMNVRQLKESIEQTERHLAEQISQGVKP